jgi:hypothetical protein
VSVRDRIRAFLDREFASHAEAYVYGVASGLAVGVALCGLLHLLVFPS